MKLVLFPCPIQVNNSILLLPTRVDKDRCVPGDVLCVVVFGLVYRENIKISSCLRPLPGFLSNLAERYLFGTLKIIVQMVLVCCISR